MSKIPELPRYLHKQGVESLLVKDEGAYLAAIEDGWQVSNHFPDEAPEPADEKKPKGKKKAE